MLRATHRFKIGDLGATRAAAQRVLELDDGAASFAATVAHLQLGITAFWSGDVPGATRPLAEAVQRERELLPLLAGRLSQREIGTVLQLSLNTVKTHGRLLFRKLGVSSRAEAVARARALGLL